MLALFCKLCACQSCAFGTQEFIETCPSISSQLCYPNYFLLTYLTGSPLMLFHSRDGATTSIVDIIRKAKLRELVLSFCKKTFNVNRHCVYLRYVNSVTLIISSDRK